MKNSIVPVASVAVCLAALLSGCGEPTKAPTTSTSTGSAISTPLLTPPKPALVISGWRRNGTGIFTGTTPPTEWDDKKNVKWKTMVGGAYSTPVVCGDKVFVTSEKSTITCLNRADGKEVWKKAIDADFAPGNFKDKLKSNIENAPSAGLATPTPVCDGEAVYAVFGTGAICCFELNGVRRWFDFIDPVGLNYGQSASPVLADGKLIVYLDGLSALDSKTGKILWEQKEIEKAYGTPAVMTLGQTKVVVTPTGAVVRLSDGKVLAKDIAENLGGDEFSISPIVQDDIAYYIDRSASAVKLELQGDTVKPKLLWNVDLEESAFGSPCLYNGLIFACGKTAHYSVLDAATGKRVMIDPKEKKVAEDFILELAPAGGQAQEMANANVYPSVAIAGKNIYVSNDQGQTFVLEAGKDYKEVKRNQLPEGSGGCLFFDGPELFIRGGDYLYCVGPK
jgi:outer membrane protein assembly factor BamB